MKENNSKIERKIKVVACILMIIMLGIIPVSALQYIQGKNKNETLEKEPKIINIEIYDFDGKRITKTRQSITREQSDSIIKLFFETEMTEKLFYKQSIERLNSLKDNNVISKETHIRLSNIFYKQMLFFEKFYKKFRTGIFFDAANIFSIVFIGLKGEKQGYLELNIPQFDFFNGTITGRFAFLGVYDGSGAVFTIGLLGFRSIYELNLQKYPEFPHMPIINGGNIGFLGVLVDIPIGETSSNEHYYLASGIALLTMWNKID